MRSVYTALALAAALAACGKKEEAPLGRRQAAPAAGCAGRRPGRQKWIDSEFQPSHADQGAAGPR
jgi:hypothetical protein